MEAKMLELNEEFENLLNKVVFVRYKKMGFDLTAEGRVTHVSDTLIIVKTRIVVKKLIIEDLVVIKKKEIELIRRIR